MTQCALCCSMVTWPYEINGRRVRICRDCFIAHLDFPRLAASLEAANGRKCIDPACETHNPKPYSLAEEFEKVEALHRRLAKQKAEQYAEMLKSVMVPAEKVLAALEEKPALCASKPPVQYIPLCFCGHQMKAHLASGICAHGECDCKKASQQFMPTPEPELCGQRYPAFDAKATCILYAGHPLGDPLTHLDANGVTWLDSKFCACGHERIAHKNGGDGCFFLYYAESPIGQCPCEKFTESTVAIPTQTQKIDFAPAPNVTSGTQIILDDEQNERREFCRNAGHAFPELPKGWVVCGHCGQGAFFL